MFSPSTVIKAPKVHLKLELKPQPKIHTVNHKDTSFQRHCKAIRLTALQCKKIESGSQAVFWHTWEFIMNLNLDRDPFIPCIILLSKQHSPFIIEILTCEKLNFCNLQCSHNCFNKTFYEYVRQCNEKEIRWSLGVPADSY